MGLAIFAFIVLFLLLASGGLLLFYRQAMMQRISTVIMKREKQQGGLKNAIQQTGSSLGVVLEQFERVLPKSQAEVSVVQQRLIRAGYRSASAIKAFYGIKVLAPVALCAVVLVSGIGKSNLIFLCGAALGLGFLAPDFVLGRMITTRQAKVRLGLPDVLDLLVICIEAGLGLDQATARTAQELSRSHPAISDELDVVVLEQRAGRPRSDAWRHMAERTDVDVVRNLVSMLVQTEQFGTSIAKTLRTHSDTLRTQRVQSVEERAAKTTVKLIFPLVLFIFPCLFLVTLGPAAILMSESFSKNLLSQ
jgi:tight adherence protein C